MLEINNSGKKRGKIPPQWGDPDDFKHLSLTNMKIIRNQEVAK